MMSWLHHHRQCLLDTLVDLLRNPFSSLMSVSVIAIALTLPGGLYAALANVNEITVDFEHGAQLSLFLEQKIEPEQALQLASKLQTRSTVQHVEVITPEQALAEFKARSGLREALDSLSRNPLPTVLQVYPTAEIAHAADQLNKLIQELGALPEVDLAQFDLEWVKRFNALIQLAHRVVWLMAVVLGLGIFLIIGNTIRLAIANRHEEIGIIRLIGGTDAFIRRPFLYSGTLQGLAGAILALLVIDLLLSFLSDPVQQLSTLYGTRFSLNGLLPAPAIALVLSGTLTGWLASRFTVGMYLRNADPGKEAE
jgi:cell division transport system permease protein